jgi:MFS family permease
LIFCSRSRENRDIAAGDRTNRSLATGVTLIIAAVLPGFLTASMAPRIGDDFAFDEATLGVAVAVFYLVSAFSSPPSGRLVERIGAVRGMRLTAAMTAASCAMVALLAHSAAGLTISLLLAGVANGMGGPAVSALLKREVAPGRQGLAFGAQQSGASLGSLMAGLALPAVAIPFGWRWAYVAAGVVGLAAAALAPPGVARPVPGTRATPPRGLSSVHAIALAAVLASAAGVGFVSFLVSYSVDNGIDEASAGLLLGGVSLVATLSRVGLGIAFDRRDAEPLRPVAAMLAASVGGYLLLIAGEPVAIVIAALLAGGLGWSWPGALTLAVVQRSPENPAWAVGVMMSGLFAGAVAGPLLVGALADRGAYSEAWALCAVLALLAGVTLALTRSKPT